MRKFVVTAVVSVVFGLPCLVAPVPVVAEGPAYRDDICATDPVPWANDDCAGRQWGLVNIHAPEAWKHGRGDGVTVAVVDSGVDPNHPDLAGKLLMLPGANILANDAYPCPVPVPGGTTTSDALPIADQGHGTMVSGVVAAAANSFGVAGVAPSATIMPVKVIDKNNFATLRNVARGICFAVDHGADVINLSLGYDPLLTLLIESEAPDKNIGGEAVEAAMRYATSKGIAVVAAAAGNSSFPICNFPAYDESAICVGSVDRADTIAPYSSFGDELDLVAPGGRRMNDHPYSCTNDENIWTTLWPGFAFVSPVRPADEPLIDTYCPSGRAYVAVSGTSFAAPHAAGVAALIVQKFRPPKDASGTSFTLDRLRRTSDDLGAPGYDPVYGHGRINALRAVSAPLG